MVYLKKIKKDSTSTQLLTNASGPTNSKVESILVNNNFPCHNAESICFGKLTFILIFNNSGYVKDIALFGL